MKRKLPPSLPGTMIGGNLKAYKKAPASYPKQLLTTHPDAKVGFLRMLNRNFFFVMDPDIVHEVLLSRADNFPKSDISVKNLSSIVGTGLFSMKDGPEHRQRRKMAQPAFTPKRIKAYVPAVVHFTKDALSRWQDGETRDIVSEMMDISMSVISKMLFDTSAPEQAREISHHITQLQKIAIAGFFRGFRWPEWLPVKTVRDTRAHRAVLNKLMDAFIDEHEASPEKYKDDLLSALLQSKLDNKIELSRADLRADLLNLFVAGHETTANTLAWTFYLLSQNPASESKLLAELDTLPDSRDLEFEDLEKLPFLDQVFKESLRIYPSAFSLVMRQARVDESLGGFEVKKGDFVSVMPYLIHRLPRFFPEPEAFRPERFEPEAEAQRHKMAFIPFGAGHRVCIGNSLAMLEGKLVLATILKRFRLVLAPDETVEQSEMLTLSPLNGLRMRLVDRKLAEVPSKT